MNYFDSCQAMLDAGITDPDSYEGKHFCTEHCPHPICVFDTKERRYSNKKSKKNSIARLRKEGKTLKEIAGALDICISTVANYLK